MASVVDAAIGNFSSLPRQKIRFCPARHEDSALSLPARTNERDQQACAYSFFCSLSPALRRRSRRSLQVTRVEVSIADLDLATKSGQRMFRRRLAEAIEEACGSYGDAEKEDWGRIDACRKAANADVRSQIASKLAASK